MKNRSMLRTAALAAMLAIAALPALFAGEGDEAIAARSDAMLRALFEGKTEVMLAEFSPEFAAEMGIDGLKAIPMQLTQSAGQAKRTGQATVVVEQEPYRTVIIPMEFEKGILNWKIVFSPEAEGAKVVGLWVEPAEDAAEGAEDGSGGRTIPLATSGAPYVDAASYREFPTQVDGLPAALTVPVTATPENPVPVVVLVHGSGPNDMDETVGANRVFLDIAQGLATKGVAVLRYTKRTRIQPEIGNNPQLTVQEEAINDALIALKAVRESVGLDGTRTFILGHSLGAFVGPDIAKQDGQLAGLILLGAPTSLSPQTVIDQLDYIVANTTQEVPADQLAMMEDMKVEFRKIMDGTADPAKMYSGTYPAYWNDLSKRDPVAMAKDSTVPMFIGFGGRDYQVPVANAEGWKTGLEGRKDTRIRVFDDLNHLFITGKGISRPDEYGVPGFVSADVINEVADFILKTKPAALQF